MINEESPSQQKSMEIIHQMIAQARANVKDNGNAWLWWGGMIFLAYVSTYILIEIRYRYTFISWNIFGVITILILLYQVFRKKKVLVRTYVEDLLRWFDLGFIICMFVIIFSINVGVSPDYGFSYFLMIYAFLMLIQGGAMQFRPLIIGAAVNWAAAIITLINDVFKYDMLISAVAVLIGYIIPGLILRAQYRKNQAMINQASHGI